MIDTVLPTTPLRRNRDFLLLWTGGAVSTVGSQMSLLVYPLLTLDLTGSAARSGLVGAVAAAARSVLRLPAGALVDRWDRRRTMLGCDLIRAGTLAGVAVCVALGRLPFGYLLVAAFVESAATVFFGPAQTAAVRRVVPRSQLARAIAQDEARYHGARLIGPPLGGALYGLGRGLPFLGDALSYAYSFVSVLLIRTPMAVQRRPTGRTRLLAEIREGLLWTWRQRLLRAILFAAAGSNLVFAGLILAAILAARESGASAATVGVMLAVASVGGILGAGVAPWIQSRGRPAIVILAIFWISAALIPVMALRPAVWLIGPALAAMLFLTPAANTILLAHQLAITPDRLQGRVASAMMLIVTLASPLGPLAVGAITQAAGSRAALGAVAATMLAVATGTSLSRRLREMPPLAEAHPADE